MSRRLTIATLVFVLGIPTALLAAEPQLSHVVFFQLKEKSEENQQKLVAACNKYLSGHEGTVYYSAGVRAADLSREVNDEDFDVSLMVVFRTKAAHDKYQTHPRHLKFIEENAELWSGVRVFDSYLPVVRGQENAGRRRIPLPDLAASFAGLIRGSVQRKADRGIVVHVEAVPKQWKHSKAEDAQSMVGQRVLVVAGDNANARRLLRVVETGETITLDVAHRQGEALTILELTEEQRARIQ